MICCFIAWKHKESFGFLMFSSGLEMQYWAKIRYLNILFTNGFHILKKLDFIWNLIIINVKNGFDENEKIDFALKFLGVVHQNKMHT